MIRRYPQRQPRRPYQDFHFFAASDPVANIESRMAHPPSIQPEPPSRAPQREDTAKSLAAEGLQLLKSFIESHSDTPEAATIAQSLPPSAEPVPSNKRTTASTKHRTRGNAAKRKLATPRRSRKIEKVESRRPETTPHISETGTSKSHHERHCTICSHSDRAEIENEFMHWHSIGDMADEYDVSRSAIYRHAYALGLFSCRNRNLRFALGHLVERVQDVEPTADSVVRAIHAFARINDEGEWVEPPAHVIVSSGGIHREAAAGPARRPISIPLDAESISGVIDVTPDPLLPGSSGEPVNFSALPSATGEPLRGEILPGTVTRVETDATR